MTAAQRRVLAAIAREGKAADRATDKAQGHRASLDEWYFKGYKMGLSIKDMADARGRNAQSVRIRLRDVCGVTEDLRYTENAKRKIPA